MQLFRGALIVGVALSLASQSARTVEPCEPSGTTSVWIDVGHSAQRPGATSARGKPEYFFNRRLARELKEALAQSKRFAPRLLSGAQKNLSLRQRAAQIRRLSDGILLSIHHDSVQPQFLRKWRFDGEQRAYSDRYKGHSLFVSTRGGQAQLSKKLAFTIGSALYEAGRNPTLHHAEPIRGENRPLLSREFGVYRFDGLAVLRNAQIPAVLIEVGVIINRDEEVEMESLAFRTQFIRTLLGALEQFCTNTST